MLLSEAGQGRAWQGKKGREGNDEANRARSGWGIHLREKQGANTPGGDARYYAMPCLAMPCHALPCHALPGNGHASRGAHDRSGEGRWKARVKWSVGKPK